MAVSNPLLRWLGLSDVEVAALPPAAGSADARADEGWPCLRLNCVNTAQIALPVQGPASGVDRRWVDLCFECHRIAPKNLITCARTWCKHEVAVEGEWCDRCRGLVASAGVVAAIRYERLMSLEELAATGSGGGEPVSGTKSPPLPLKFAAYALADEMVQLWEQALVVLIGRVGPTRGGRLLANRPAVVRLREAALFVGPRAAELLASDDGRFLAGELLRVEGSAVRVLGLDEPAAERRQAPCPRCDLRLLVRVPGEDKSRCENCGHEIGDESYGLWSKQWAKFEQSKAALVEREAS